MHALIKSHFPSPPPPSPLPTLIWKARLRPEAKKPPKGAMSDAKTAMTNACIIKGRKGTAGGMAGTKASSQEGVSTEVHWKALLG